MTDELNPVLPNTEATTTPDPEPQVPDQPAPTTPEPAPDFEQEKKQLSGKIQKLQTDLNDITGGRPVSYVKKIMPAAYGLDDMAYSVPGFKERLDELVAKATKGTLTAAETKELQKATETPPATPSPTPQTPAQSTPETDWIRKRMKTEQTEQAKLIKDLEGERHEEINKQTDFRTNQNPVRAAVGSYASMLMRSKGMSQNAALKSAYAVVLNHDKIQEESYIAGMAGALEKSASTGSPQVSPPVHDTKVDLPPAQKKRYDELVSSDGQERADRYYDRIKSKLEG